MVKNMFDLLIKNGTVVDGTGKRRFVSDIGVKEGLIADIGSLKHRNAKRIIDVNGLIVSPGFIDCHTHSDLSVLHDPARLPKVSQGVTTEVVGNCGMSAAPINKKTLNLMKEYVKPVLGDYDSWSWNSVADYLKIVEKANPVVNVAALIGHGTIRTSVMGFENRPPTSVELNLMKELIREGMEAGAFGISTGLSYPPGTYASTDELVELSKVVVEYGGIYATHLRDQVDGLVDSVNEAITIAEQTNIPIIISHHKTVGKRNTGRVKETLSLLDNADERGYNTSSDTYPYTKGSTSLAAILPPWAVEGGFKKLFERLKKLEIREKIKRDFLTGLKGWENRSKALGWENIIISFVQSDKNFFLEKMSIQEASEELNKQPADFVMDILIEEEGNVGVIFNNSTETDLQMVMAHRKTMIGSDGLDVGDNPHPRLYGTFPKVLSKYVRETNLLTLEEAIHKMTGLTVTQFGIEEVGFIKKRYRADFTIFNLDNIKDEASFENSRELSKGIQYVIVGGEVVYENRKMTGIRNGKVLRRTDRLDNKNI